MSSVLLKMPMLRKGMPLSPSSRALRPGVGEMLFLAWIPWKLVRGNPYSY
uniref:Alternative protein TRIM13 n=1 Tax=Homo sapiens TaxID=9606 RepID=L8E9D0_HUMAN|nr:alternative protein TRIM13 [Homo sapiens]